MLNNENMSIALQFDNRNKAIREEFGLSSLR